MDQAGLGKVSPVSYLLVACIVQSFFFFSFPPGQKARIYISWAESVRGACQHEKKKKRTVKAFSWKRQRLNLFLGRFVTC